jgi:hypothetical protein
VSTASDEFRKVVEEGQNFIRRQAMDNEQSFQEAIARLGGGTTEKIIDLSAFDPDLKELFNTYANSPLMQLVLTNVQLVRRSTATQLLVQAAVAKLAGVPAPATEAALAGSGE